MINNNVKAKHLGGGVVLFESAIDLDWDYVREFSRDAINKEKEDMYTPTVDPETGDEIYLNKSGYFFQKESVDQMPGRGSAIHRYGDEKIKKALITFMISGPQKISWQLEMLLVMFSTLRHLLTQKKN